MASLVVVALVMTVAGVVVGALVAISFAINRGYRVTSLIWQRPDESAKSDRSLVDSSRRG
jgi:hypothetical protein